MYFSRRTLQGRDRIHHNDGQLPAGVSLEQKIRYPYFDVLSFLRGAKEGKLAILIAGVSPSSVHVTS